MLQPVDRRHRRTSRFLVPVVGVSILALSLVWAVPAGAAPGDPDPAFGVDGVVLSEVGLTTGRESSDAAVAALADQLGRLVVVGNSNGPNGLDGIAIARYLGDGSLDPSFGVGGQVMANLGAAGGSEVVSAAALDDSGRIIVAGSFEDDLLVARFLADGTLDPAFGSSGFRRVPTGEIALGEDVAIDASGRIIVVGQDLTVTTVGPTSFYDYDVIASRLDATGTIDTTFGTGGIARVDVGTGDFGRGVAALGDEVVIGGAANGDFLAIRLDESGTPNPAFGSGGLALIDGGSTDDYADSAAVDSSGRVILGGRVEAEPDLGFVRLLANGTPDSSFGTGGVARLDLGQTNGNGELVRDVVVDAAGRIVAAAWSHDGGGFNGNAVRLLDAGSPDPGFGSGGVVSLSRPDEDRTDAIALVGTDVVAVGNVSDRRGDFAVYRLDDGGTPVAGFGASGIVLTDFAAVESRSESIFDAVRLPDGRIAVAGGTFDSVDSDLVVALYAADGTLDTSFGGDGIVTSDVGAYDEAYGVLYQAGVGLVIAGYTDNQAIIQRYDMTGALDPTFGGTGQIVFTPPSGSGYIWELGEDATGRIVATGGDGSDVMVARMSANGLPDGTFGNGGISTIDIGRYGYGSSVSFDAAGRIVVAAEGGPSIDVIRLTLAGALDTTFGGGDGIATANNPARQENATKAVIDASGRIVVSGWSYDGPVGAMLAVRFDDTGQLDPTFDNDGIALVNEGDANNRAAALAIDDGGRIVLVGRERRSTAYADFAIARILDDGSPDLAFGVQGIAIADLGDDDEAQAVLVDASGYVAVGNGGLRDDVALVRFQGDGGDTTAPDTSITSGPASPTTSRDVLVVFEGADNQTPGGGLTFTCRLDGGAALPCTTPLTTTVEPGSHLFEVAARDASGNTDATPATHAWIVLDGDSGTSTPGAATTVSTGTDPTPADPLETTVTVPAGTAGGPVSITEVLSPSVPAPTGYALLGFESQITAPSGTASSPLEFRFVLDASAAATAGVDELTLQILRNGVPVANCTTVGPLAIDPCVVERSRLGNGDISIRVLTSVASAWTLAARLPFAFGGFRQPVDPLPTLNKVKAGSGVPVKFSLGGNLGLDIFAATYPRSSDVACEPRAVVDPIESTVSAGGSSLAYDPETGVYTYVWKTDKEWRNTCRQLVIRFADGSSQRATFQFSK